MSTVYNKHISNPPEWTWRDWIENGVKTYEGRVFMKDWKNIKVGDRIRFYNENRSDLWVEVTELRRFKDFDSAYDELGIKLIPVLPNNMSANDVYVNVVGFKWADIVDNGVVAVGIKVIKV